MDCSSTRASIIKALELQKEKCIEFKTKYEKERDSAINEEERLWLANNIAAAERTAQNIEQEISETNIILSLKTFLERAECGVQKYRNKLHAAEKQIKWYMEELSRTQNLLVNSERLVADHESTINHLKFTLSLKQTDEHLNSETFPANEFEMDSRLSLPYMGDSFLGSNATFFDRTNFGYRTLGDITRRNRTAPINEEPELESHATVEKVSEKAPKKELQAEEERRNLQLELGFGSDEDDASKIGSSSSRFNNNSERLKTFKKTALKHYANKPFEMAVPYCEQAINYFEKELGADHLDVATAVNVLATLYRQQECFEEAVKCLLRVLNIRESALGANHIDVASTLNNLSICYEKSKNYEQAELFCKRSLSIREKVFGSNSTEAAKQLVNLAYIQRQRGDYASSADCYRKYLHIHDLHGSSNSADEVENMKMNLAASLLGLGQYEEAEVIYKEIIASTQNRFYDKNMNASSSQNAQGTSKRRQVIWEVAEESEAQQDRIVDGKTDGHASLLETIDINDANMMTAIRKLTEIYRHKRCYVAAEVLDDVDLRARRQQNITIKKSKRIVKPVQQSREAKEQNKGIRGNNGAISSKSNEATRREMKKGAKKKN